jgi:hypothetical protein
VLDVRPKLDDVTLLTMLLGRAWHDQQGWTVVVQAATEALWPAK